MLNIDSLNNVGFAILTFCGIVGAALVFLLLLLLLTVKHVQRRLEYRREHTFSRELDHYLKKQRQLEHRAKSSKPEDSS